MYKNECQFPSKHQDKENKWPQAKAKIPCPQIAVPLYSQTSNYTIILSYTTITAPT